MNAESCHNFFSWIFFARMLKKSICKCCTLGFNAIFYINYRKTIPQQYSIGLTPDLLLVKCHIMYTIENLIKCTFSGQFCFSSSMNSFKVMNKNIPIHDQNIAISVKFHETVKLIVQCDQEILDSRISNRQARMEALFFKRSR